MTWHIGQRIVCVDGNRYPGFGKGWEILPVKGVVYTIMAFDPVPCATDPKGSVRFLLNEIRNPPADYVEGFCEASFGAKRFRPVINAERDLAEFEAILRGVETKREVVEA